MTASLTGGTAPDGADPQGDISIPALLRGARGSYAHAIAAFLAEAGCDDLPQNGPFVLGGMARHRAPAVDMIRGLGVTRQAASQLIDTLVVRGYLSREVNPADRRRLNIELTDRGRAAAEAIAAAVGRVDEELTAMITPAELAGLRAGLIALATIKERTRCDGQPKDI
ncbi:MAG: MarR family transcriptional regulator [Streptosporangiaceae bacterium]|nr:MarR family transcriptional regulator [Streptosporangiaceae bacterium]